MIYFKYSFIKTNKLSTQLYWVHLPSVLIIKIHWKQNTDHIKWMCINTGDNYLLF